MARQRIFLPVSAAEIAADAMRVASEQSVEPEKLGIHTYLDHGGIYSERKIQRVGGWPLVKRTFLDKAPREESAVRAQQQVNTEVNRLRRFVGDTEWMAERIAAGIEKLPPVRVSYSPKPARAGIQRSLTLNLSDTHWGADLYQAEHLSNYGPAEEAAALWSVVKNVCEYKLEHRRETELVVNLLGDIIENQLHGPAGSAPLHIQTCRAIYLLNQAMGLFAAAFPKVRVNVAVGNHGRDMAVHPTRATSQKFNGIETTIYYAVKAACRGLKHVEFNQPLTPWVDYYAQGHRFYATHGDTHLNPGNPGNRVDVKSLENQTNRINSTLKGAEVYKVFVCGHAHQAMVTQLVNGAIIVVNGALTPPNGYAQTLNIMRSPQIQTLWETTRDHPVGDFRFINASQDVRGSKVKPLLGLDDF